MTGPPAVRPCESCPYRRDVPPGIWHASEYDKLRRYDGETPTQPLEVFVCHQFGRGAGARICAGWAGCHDGDELFSLRWAISGGDISAETFRAIIDYVSPVPLFGSGAEAAEHGMSGQTERRPDTVRLAAKLARLPGMQVG